MKNKLILRDIAVKRSKTHGYGVFAEKNIKKGTIMEQCYFILTKGGDRTLEDYYFDAKGKYAVFTGYGSIYNHSEDANADYVFNMKTRIVTIKADRAIKKGEEIFVSYGDEWFSSRGLKPKKVATSQKGKARI